MIKDYTKQIGRKIFLKSQFININEVTHIYCQDYISTVFYKNGKVSVSKQLCKFEEELKDLGFFRINRSLLINLFHVEAFDSKLKEITISNGSTFSISRRKAQLLRGIG